MPQSILVTGATGRLGRLIVRRLIDLGQPVRAFTRRPEVALSIFGPNIEVAHGDFSEPDSLDHAFTSVDRILLLSPISDHLVRDQVAVIEAAERAGARRVVKISGSHWTIAPPGRSISGTAHAEVERYLAATDLESVAIRPNAWMQVSLPRHITSIKSGLPLSSAHGDAPVSYIDARDIADVAVHQLLARWVERTPLVITGSEALSIRDIAGLAARLAHRPVAVVPVGPRPLATAPIFEERAVSEFMTLIAEGRASELTDTVPRLLGRAPRTVEGFLSEHLEAVAS
jgi:uncharacterized protein YbjT (DUF2867 family)